MQGVTHMAGGAAFAAVYTLVAHPGLSIGQEAAIIGIGALGGLIPDIDHPNSKISHKLKPVSAVVSLMFSHRGFFHTHPLPRVVGDLGDALSRDRVFGVWPIAFSGYCIPSRFGQFELCWDSHALSIQQKTTPYCQNQNRQ